MRRVLCVAASMMTVSALSGSTCLGFGAFGDDGVGLGDGPGTLGAWTALTSYPCGFNRTDALWVDDDFTIWTGCGTNTEGVGLYQSTDDGASWVLFQPAAPAGARTIFDDFRVVTISRSSDGKLYVGGNGPSTYVVSVDEADTVAQVLQPTGLLSTDVGLVGNFRRNSAGQAIAVGQNNGRSVFRESDSADWVTTDGGLGDEPDPPYFSPAGVSRAFLDLEVDNGGRFHGSGGSISTPNTHLREVDGPNFLNFAVTELSSDAAQGGFGWDGEGYGVAVNDDGSVVIVAAVEGSANNAVLFVINDDVVGDVQFVKDTFATSNANWPRDACFGGGVFAIVGEEPINSDDALAWVIISRDNGATWQDITPPAAVNPGALHKCHIVGDTLYAAGAGGSVLTYGL